MLAQGLDEDEGDDALAENVTSVVRAQELVSRLIAVVEAEHEESEQRNMLSARAAVVAFSGLTHTRA